MKLNKLSLSNFRSYQSQLFEFKKPTTIIVGPNTSGKTSIIEAANMLASGDSFRANRIEQMINFEADLSRIKALVEIDDEELELEILLTDGTVNGKKTRKRHFSINSTKRSKAKFTGQLLAVVFKPADMRLIEGSPSRRRNFMDGPLSLVSREYERALKTYSKALTQRNRLLSQIREGEMPRSALTYWTMTILKHGQILQQQRRQFFEFFQTVDFPLEFKVEYDLSAITEERLEKYAEREIAAGYTLVGPHKDDLLVRVDLAGAGIGDRVSKTSNFKDVATYGSRGQRRLTVLWLKTCELAFLEAETEQKPILLLDDILSELDEQRRQLVLGLLDGHQALLTTASERSAQEIHQQRPESAIMRLG